MADPHGRIFGRVVSKKEYKQILETNTLLAQKEGELIPAFDATNIMDILPTKPDDLKNFSKGIGSHGEAYDIVLFKTDEFPEADGIPARKLRHIKEAKFRTGTKIEILR